MCEPVLSTVSFMKFKYRSSILDENVMPELRCDVNVKYTQISNIYYYWNVNISLIILIIY